MFRKLVFLTGLIFLPLPGLFAQDKPDTVPARIINGDTVAVVDLKAFMTFPGYGTPVTRREAARYDRLVYNVRKVYPYAKLAGIKLMEYDQALGNIHSEKERKAYIKNAEKELEDKFGADIRDLTYSQGKILIKLIYRQTGNSSFEIVRELRGKFSAFVWQTLASLFGYDLKTGYDPVHDPQDQAIERIVLSIEEGSR
jgi:hypothetical protein